MASAQPSPEIRTSNSSITHPLSLKPHPSKHPQNVLPPQHNPDLQHLSQTDNLQSHKQLKLIQSSAHDCNFLRLNLQRRKRDLLPRDLPQPQLRMVHQRPDGKSHKLDRLSTQLIPSAATRKSPLPHQNRRREFQRRILRLESFLRVRIPFPSALSSRGNPSLTNGPATEKTPPHQQPR